MSDDDTAAECHATATGILDCLRMLAEEAASLRLSRTLDALREAIETCAVEHAEPRIGAGPLPRGRLIH